VNQNNVVRLDAQLQLGAQSQKVEVTAESAVLQTDRADVHSEIATHALENLPQVNRTAALTPRKRSRLTIVGAKDAERHR
jgi:hypothetical protein